jgi:hypothetical protein
MLLLDLIAARVIAAITALLLVEKQHGVVVAHKGGARQLRAHGGGFAVENVQ